MVSGYDQFPWITLCQTKRKAFCIICLFAKSKGLILFSKCSINSTFFSSGFDNWKKGAEKFASHEQSLVHKEAAMKWKTFGCPSVGECLDSVLTHDQNERRLALVKVIDAMKYLLRQGLAIRGHVVEEGNLEQLIQTWAADHHYLRKFVREKSIYHL